MRILIKGTQGKWIKRLINEYDITDVDFTVDVSDHNSFSATDNSILDGNINRYDYILWGFTPSEGDTQVMTHMFDSLMCTYYNPRKVLFLSLQEENGAVFSDGMFTQIQLFTKQCLLLGAVNNNISLCSLARTISNLKLKNPDNETTTGALSYSLALRQLAEDFKEADSSNVAVFKDLIFKSSNETSDTVTLEDAVVNNIISMYGLPEEFEINKCYINPSTGLRIRVLNLLETKTQDKVLVAEDTRGDILRLNKYNRTDFSEISEEEFINNIE